MRPRLYTHHGGRLATLLLLAPIASLGASLPATASACPNTALRGLPSSHLPDCRAYEQVSPPEKHGADATPATALFPTRARAPQAGASTEAALAYMSLGSFAGSAADDTPNAYIGSRGEGGWQTQSLTPPTPAATPSGLAPVGYDFSSDLSQFVLKVPLQRLPPNVTPPAPAGVYNLYLSQPGSSNYSLVTTLPPTASICDECFSSDDVPAFAGASSDFSHILFEANESLTPGAPAAPADNLYESAGGQVRLVGVLPDGTIAAGGAEPGAGISPHYTALDRGIEIQDVNHAISADGSRILFAATADGGVPDSAQAGLTELYDRLGASSTVEVSAPANGAAPANPAPEPAQFWTASADGSLVFFTSSAELTTQSRTGEGNASQDLYQYNLDSGVLTDLTVDANPLDIASGAGVVGVLGAAQDGSSVYFVARGQLVGGKGLDGAPNLYVSHAGKTSFIATLSERDSHDWSSTPGELQSYLTPDGRNLAFMSVNSLTGYDNRDRNSGEADSEVYWYSEQSGELTCVSCDPNGAPPVGGAFIGARAEEWMSTPFYEPRTLSDDGRRLFFSSPDPLTPAAGNLRVNVFEYENGSVSLISSGTSSSDDLFLDASPTGDDVFFATRQALASTDDDELIDIYDARVDGGFPSPSSETPCTGSVCQGSPSALPDLPSALSATFAGLSDLSAPASTQKAKAKKAKHKPTKKRKAKKRRKTKKKRRGKKKRKARRS